MVIRKKPIPAILEIDTTGPDGNAYVLIAYARRLAIHYGLDAEAIVKEMQAGSYEDLIKTMDRHLGRHIVILR